MELYGRYMPLVYGVSLKYLKNVPDAEDMVMKLYEELREKLLQYSIGLFRSYLYTCVRNACLMEIRRRSKNISVELDEKFMEFCDDFDLEEVKEREGRAEALKACLEALPEKQQKCVQHFFMEERSYKEIVEASGYTLKMVKSFIQNGKRNLRLCLKQKGIQ